MTEMPVDKRPATRLTPAVVATAATLALLAGVLAAVVAVHLSDRNSTTADAGRRAEVLAAARASVVRVLSYDYRHLPTDVRAAETVITPHFRPQYDRTFEKGVQPLAAKYRATSTAVIPADAAGITSIDGDTVHVLVFVTQTATNSQLAAPRLDRSRIDVTLKLSGGRWLIDALKPI